MTTSPDIEAAEAEKPSLAVGVIVLVTVVGFIALHAALGLETGYAGLLFFWYWGVFGKVEFRALSSTVIGAVGGTGTAWLLQYLASTGNGTGQILVLLAIAVAIVVQVTDRLPIAINPAFMLFLTVFAAPVIERHENFLLVFASIGLAVLYFGGIVAIIGMLRSEAAVEHSEP